MIWRYCTACFRGRGLTRLRPLLYLCDLCTDELQELHLGRSQRLHNTRSLYRYDGLVRRLILRAKVAGDHRALLLLTTLAAGQAEALSMATWADALVAAPASFWGRVRGRLDLGAHVAYALGRATGRPVLAAPVHMHWRWRKQALRARQDRRPPARALPAWLLVWSTRRFARHLDHHVPRTDDVLDPRAVRLLLIDDVVTSGVTLAALTAAVAGSGATACQVRRLTLAATKP